MNDNDFDSLANLDDLPAPVGSVTSEPPTNLPARRAVRDVEHVVGTEIIAFHELQHELVDAACFELMEIDVARSRRATPIEIDGDLVTVGVVDPSDIVALDDLRMRLGRYDVRFVAVGDEALEALLARWSREVARADETSAVRDISSEIKTAVVEEADDNGRMAQLVNKILEQAIAVDASDVHIEPSERNVYVRFRVDGVLQAHAKYPLNISGSMVNRIKIISGMEIAERRVPQDGRFGRKLSGKDIDCRVVTLPTAEGGEGVVIRLFDQSRARMQLNEIGFHDDVRTRFEEVLSAPHGLILVTGPTGSGKTTTLYASLGLVARPDRKTLTIEDPVEIRLGTVTQMQVNEKANLTFASALRSFLRADPDVMLVGEIRDADTASLAAQAALTGHLVLSTLHTNEASGAATRLSNLGLESFVTASALKAVLAQRLIRRVCTRCAVPYEPTDAELNKVRWPKGLERPSQLMRAKSGGCEHCSRLGYRGRLPIAELVVIDGPMIAAITDRATSSELERLAQESGTVSLHDDACRYAAEGLTSIDEILRAGV